MDEFGLHYSAGLVIGLLFLGASAIFLKIHALPFGLMSALCGFLLICFFVFEYRRRKIEKGVLQTKKADIWFAKVTEYL